MLFPKLIFGLYYTIHNILYQLLLMTSYIPVYCLQSVLPPRTESLTYVNRFSLVGELLSCVRYSYVTRKETLDEGLTSTSNRLVMFVSSYLQSITPTANYIAGLAIRFYNIETERQFAFDYAGNIYTRMKNLPNGEWTNWERKTT